jgi:hypothetical protein
LLLGPGAGAAGREAVGAEEGGVAVGAGAGAGAGLGAWAVWVVLLHDAATNSPKMNHFPDFIITSVRTMRAAEEGAIFRNK